MTLPMMPDGNNVYGQIFAPLGLHPVLQTVRRLIGDERASSYKSQFNGAETLRFSTNGVDFESTPLENDGRHLLNGVVAGDRNNVVAFAEAMSQLLTEAGIEHRFEVYDQEQNL